MNDILDSIQNRNAMRQNFSEILSTFPQERTRIRFTLWGKSDNYYVKHHPGCGVCAIGYIYERLFAGNSTVINWIDKENLIFPLAHVAYVMLYEPVSMGDFERVLTEIYSVNDETPIAHTFDFVIDALQSRMEDEHASSY